MVDSCRRYLPEASGMEANLVLENFAIRLQRLDGPSLVVFDNVGTLDDCLKFESRDGVTSFLVTSPASSDIQTPGPKYNVIAIGPMDNHQSMRLRLKGLFPNDQNHAIELPLAISHFDEYLARNLRRSVRSILRESSRASASFVKKHILQQLKNTPPPVHEYLAYLACLDTEGISVELLEKYHIHAPTAISAMEAQESLMRLPGIRFKEGTQDILIHPVLQQMVLDEVRARNCLEHVAALVMDVLAELYCIAARHLLHNLETLDSYARHVDAVMALEPATAYRAMRPRRAKAELFNAMATLLTDRGIFGRTEETLGASIRVYQSLSGPEFLRPGVVSGLTRVCRMHGREAEAHQLESRFQETTREFEEIPEVGDREADEVEIESVVSNLPSLTAGSTVSSALTTALLADIKSDVLTILSKDEELCVLFKETPRRIRHDKFQRNFLRLFRSFLSDLRKQYRNGEQELHQVIRILRFQSRNIASHICQEIFDLKAQSDALSSLALQAPDKHGHLVSFLEDNRYGSRLFHLLTYLINVSLLTA
jgi:hypothetical protein